MPRTAVGPPCPRLRRRQPSGGYGDVGLPGFGDAADTHAHPRLLSRRARCSLEAHVGLIRSAVALVEVARPACGRDVLPLVAAAARTWQHVVDRVGMRTAVLAAMVVAHEHGSSRKRGAAMERHLHDVAESNDERVREGEVLRPELRTVVLDEL